MFDINAPILTPTTRHTLDVGLPTSQVTALATTSSRNFNVQWTGTDDANGSGIASYDIYVSIDSAPPVLWLADQTNSNARYAGELNRQYSFYSIATWLEEKVIKRQSNGFSKYLNAREIASNH